MTRHFTIPDVTITTQEKAQQTVVPPGRYRVRVDRVYEKRPGALLVKYVVLSEHGRWQEIWERFPFCYRSTRDRLNQLLAAVGVTLDGHSFDLDQCLHRTLYVTTTLRNGYVNVIAHESDDCGDRSRGQEVGR